MISAGKAPREGADLALLGTIRELLNLKTKPGLTRGRKLVWAGACIVVVFGAIWGVVHLLRAPDPNKLLARAYAERRTIELRMPGAAFGPMRVQRGSGEGHQNLPAALLEAEMILVRDAKRHVEDPAWLQARARASLLEWDYESAIRELEDALVLKPDDSELLLDKAMAYFERAEKLGPQGAIDYGEAAQDLSRALKKNREDGTALFNRAIVFEKLHLPNEAVADLEHYLRINPDGPWGDEAKERLQRLQELVKDHEAALTERPADAVTFVRLASDAAGADRLDQRIEDYQDLAIREWLPGAFPVRVPVSAQRNKRNESRAALRVLANLLLKRHQDAWLTHLLASANESPSFALALEELSEAVVKSANGDPHGSLRAATKAVAHFAEAGNSAGAFRARMERVHALQRSHQLDECRREGSLVQASLRETSYTWMEGQLGIDQAACSLTAADFDEGQSLAATALRRSEADIFPALYLRAIGIASSGNNFKGDVAAAWGSNEEGLAYYWQLRWPSPIRVHQFYDDLAYAAEILDEPDLALEFAQESANTASLSENKHIEILARQHAAKIAVDAKDWSAAEDQLAKVELLVRSIHDEAAQHSSHLYSETTLAEIDMREGRMGEAGARLARAEHELPLVGNLSLNLDFRRTKADLLLEQGRYRDAEAELLLALDKVDASQMLLKDRASRRLWVQENSALYKSLVYVEIRLGDSKRALAVWEQYLAAGLRLGKPAGGVNEFASRNKVRELILPLTNETIVSYALLPQGLAIWVADDRGIKFRFVQAVPATLATLSSNFLGLCADPQSDLKVLKRRGRQLFDIFIAPIAQELSQDRSLSIETDPLIGDLPFQALAGPDGRYLSENYTLAFSPGLLYRPDLRPLTKISPGVRALVVASTAKITGEGVTLQPDEDSVAEAREVAARFTRATLMESGAAMRQRIEPALSAAVVFHFSGHALSGVTEEGLLLHSARGDERSELWTARDVDANSFKKCRLAVLSACSTGRNLGSRREIHGGMIRALLSAGVPEVVATRWEVDSLPTRRFMRVFYDALLAGDTAAAGVRKAELTLMRVTQTEHPYYWAAFAAFGRA